MSDFYEEAADFAGVPEELREGVIESVMADTVEGRKMVLRDLAERMHAKVMDAKTREQH